METLFLLEAVASISIFVEYQPLLDTRFLNEIGVAQYSASAIKISIFMVMYSFSGNMASWQ